MRGRDDLETSVRFEDAGSARFPAAENIRVGLRELDRRGLLEIRVERRGRPSETYLVSLRRGEGVNVLWELADPLHTDLGGWRNVAVSREESLGSAATSA